MAGRENEKESALMDTKIYRNILSKKTAAIIGLGGIGCMTAQLLAREGIGTLVLVDKDKVEKSNLQRQILYDTKDIGKDKVGAAKAKLARISPKTDIKTIKAQIAPDNISKLGAFRPDIILDCTDNLRTRLAINGYCEDSAKASDSGIPWIFATAQKSKGMVCTIADKKARDWFEHVFAGKKAKKEQVLSTACNAIACIQATEALKLLCGHNPTEELLWFDICKGELRKIKR